MESVAMSDAIELLRAESSRQQYGKLEEPLKLRLRMLLSRIMQVEKVTLLSWMHD
jgi:hypothetical protein